VLFRRFQNPFEINFGGHLLTFIFIPGQSGYEPQTTRERGSVPVTLSQDFPKTKSLPTGKIWTGDRQAQTGLLQDKNSKVAKNWPSGFAFELVGRKSTGWSAHLSTNG